MTRCQRYFRGPLVVKASAAKLYIYIELQLLPQTLVQVILAISSISTDIKGERI